MKDRVVLILCFCVSAFARPALAQTTQSQPATPNFAIVNFNAVVLQTTEAQRDLGALQTKFAPREARLQALNTEVEGLRKQLADTGSKLSEAEQASRTPGARKQGQAVPARGRGFQKRFSG